MKKLLVIIITILCVLFIIGIVGSVWNISASKAELAQYSAEGQMVDVHDTKMHVFTAGKRKGNEPAIVMIAGLNTPSPVADYYPLWSRLQEEHLVVVLERPGYGWSGTTSRERTVENMVMEDRMALKNAGIEAPYVLVAHSIGGLEAAYYASEFPQDIAGVVLIDATSPEAYLAGEQNELAKLPGMNKIVPVLRSTGVLRIVGSIMPKTITKRSWAQRNDFANVSDHYKEIDLIFTLQKYCGKNINEETKNRAINAATVNETVFPEGLPIRLAMVDYDTDEQEYLDFIGMQQSWVEQSTNGKAYLFEGGHYLHHYVPDKICELIEDVL